MDPLLPLKPRRAPGLPAPPVAATYKGSAADFVVEEIPAYLPSGEGEHVFAWIEKQGISTPVAIERMAVALGVNPRHVGYAGLKDALAVSRQWLSFDHVAPEALAALTLQGIRVLQVARHGNKLRIGHLRGNRFEVVLRAAPGATLDAEAEAAVAANLGWLAERGVPNWVGEQRFGRNGRNLEKGLAVLAGRGRRYARSMDKRMVRLLIAAVQSEVFNHVLTERVEDFDRVVAGDVAWRHQNGACFLVEDAPADQPRAEAFEISPSGPLPGPRMLRAGGDQGELEADVLEAMELDCEIFGAVRGAAVPGARRPLRVRLDEPRVELRDGVLQLRFGLEKGAFATSVLRELVADPPWFDDPGPAATEPD